MARGGHVYVAEYPPDNRYITELEAAAEEAVEAELGMWGPCSGVFPVPCDPAYPAACIPSPPPDLDCDDVSSGGFVVLPPDPHGFDADGDGIGCES
jgi:micrococcal nuclease